MTSVSPGPRSPEPKAGIADRTFLITGGNAGIGLATATALARDGGRVYLACRDSDRGAAAVTAIKAAAPGATVALMVLDLARLASVRACAEAFLSRDEPLHVLINNAGIGGHRGATTADGFEIHFGVNHLGHFALTMALLERLKASGPDARVVTVASQSHYGATGVNFDALRKPGSFTGSREYAVSKLCNVLFTQELARRLGGPDADVTAYCLHPGVVASEIWRRIPKPFRGLVTRRMISTEQGAKTSLHCATSPMAARQSGMYYDECRIKDPSRVATAELAGQLWQRSAEWTGVG